MKILIFSLLLFFCCSILVAQTGRVIKVKDGDTIVILDTENVQHIIRVANIDCPERGQPFSNVAKTFVSEEIYGDIVIVESIKVDKYNRVVGNVFYQNKSLSEELLKNGLAWHYTYFSNSAVLSDLEATAKKQKIGLWSEKNPINPYNWRKGIRH